jgi:hypothetical protein
VKGFNAKRTFKTITEDRETRLDVRPPKLAESAALLTAVAASGVLDPVSNQQTLVGLAEAESEMDAPKASKNNSHKLVKTP